MANGSSSRGNSVVGERWPLFWAGCAAISVGVALHLPMLAMAHTMGNHLSGMPMDGWMYMGMALIGIGVPAAIFGALPKKRPDHRAGAGAAFEAPDDTPLTRSHAAVLLVLTLGLIIDTMKPATLGFVLPGMRGEYGLAKSTVAQILAASSVKERSINHDKLSLACTDLLFQIEDLAKMTKSKNPKLHVI